MANRKSGTETFTKLLVSHADRLGDSPAVSEKRRGIWHTRTWSALAAEVEVIAAALAARGLQRGATVVMLGDSRPHLFSTLCAVHAVGAVAAPVYHDATTSELAAAIRMTAATHAFAQDQEQVDKLLEVMPEAPTLTTIVFDEDKGMRHYRHPQLVSYEALSDGAGGDQRALVNALRERAEETLSNDDAFIFFTPGAEGSAKGIVHSHGSLIGRARAAAAIDHMLPEHIVMAVLPPAWSCQSLLGYAQPMAVGSCACFPESIDTLLDDLREMAPHYFLTTPRMLDAIAARISVRIKESGGTGAWLYQKGISTALDRVQEEAAGTARAFGDRIWDAVYGKLVYRPLRDVLGMTRIRAAYTAGDALDPAMLSFFRSLGINIKQVYGTTETGYFDTLQRDGEVVAGSVGRAVDGVELQIAEDGEVLVRSPGLCKSMLGPDGRSAPAIDADGWLPTGDVGEINDRGDLIITDRKSDIGAMADGTRFVPRPIENRLRHSPLIREAVVFGNGRDRVCALIDINTGSVAQWADGEGMTYTGHADLAAQPETCKLIAERVAEINDVLAKDGMAHAQIRRFVLLPQELSAEDGLLTRSGRLKRDAIGERYSGLIDALYGSADKVTIERQTEDQEDTQAVLRIQDVEARGHTSNRRAA